MAAYSQLRNSREPPKLVLDILQFSAEGASENTVGETECNNNSFEKKIEGGEGFPLQEYIANLNKPLLREPLSLLGSMSWPCWVWDRRHSAPSLSASFWKTDSGGDG